MERPFHVSYRRYNSLILDGIDNSIQACLLVAGSRHIMSEVEMFQKRRIDWIPRAEVD